MKRRRSIIYFGADPDFLKELKVFASAFKEVSIEARGYVRGDLLSSCLTSLPHIVFTDFTSHEWNLDHLLDELLLLKRIAGQRGCLFVALFADDDQLKKFSHLFTSG